MIWWIKLFEVTSLKETQKMFLLIYNKIVMFEINTIYKKKKHFSLGFFNLNLPQYIQQNIIALSSLVMP